MHNAQTDFLLKDGTIDTAAAMEAGRLARAKAFHKMVRPRRQPKSHRATPFILALAIVPFSGFFFLR